MSLDIAALINAARDHALATGLFALINGHDPDTPIPDGLDAAVTLRSIRPSKRVSGLSATGAAVTLTMNIYSKALDDQATPTQLDQIDPAVGDATSAMIGLLSGDYTLGGMVFAVDLLGMNGLPLGAENRSIKIAATIYRFVSITIPLLIDNVWTQGVA